MANKEQSKRWYALYTKSRNEKKVNERLKAIGVETYLPLKKSLRQWSDRKKIVDMPLINSYIFVRTIQENLYELIKVEGVTRYISFSGRPVQVRDNEIELLKEFLENDSNIDVIDGIPKVGKQIKFTKGIFKDYEGKIVKINRKNQIAIEIESIGKSIVVNFDMKDFL